MVEGTAGSEVVVKKVSPSVGFARSGVLSVGDGKGVDDVDAARAGGSCSWASVRECWVTSSRRINEEKVVG